MRSITELKHVIDQAIHIIRTLKTDETGKNFIVITIVPPDKRLIEDKKLLPRTKKYQDVNGKEAKFTGK